ncbi:DMT family transporter [Dickeya fangzhongdai]|uniref:DMT family transporter n=1 Tax=Dickeya TaxID=204037 RepID=UPI00039EA108|nr:EamA family transporter [Dickeya sp. NCPPB 3274]WPD73894.1 DMT family transporter [Dickeya fangzhongdai]
MKYADVMRLFSLAAIWGASFLFMRVASPAIGAINTAFFRVLLGFMGLSLLLGLLGTRPDFRGKLGTLLLLGVINSGVPFLMYCLAALSLPAGYSAILNATTPLMGACVGFLFFSEPITARKLLGAFLGLAGVMLMTTTGSANSVIRLIPGMAACLMATACYAVAGFLTKRWITDRGGLAPMLVATGSQLGATLFLLPFFIYSVMTVPISGWQPPALWISILALGLVCTALAYVLYFRLIADIGPLKSLSVTFLIPPFGILWGWAGLGEQLSTDVITGGIMIVIAVWLVLHSPASQRRT